MNITIDRTVLWRASEALRPQTAPSGAKRDAAFEELRAALAAQPERKHTEAEAPTSCTCPTRDALDAMLVDTFKRRAVVEQSLFDMAAGKLPMPDAAKLREMAIYLGVPK